MFLNGVAPATPGHCRVANDRRTSMSWALPEIRAAVKRQSSRTGAWPPWRWYAHRISHNVYYVTFRRHRNQPPHRLTA